MAGRHSIEKKWSERLHGWINPRAKFIFRDREDAKTTTLIPDTDTVSLTPTLTGGAAPLIMRSALNATFLLLGNDLARAMFLAAGAKRIMVAD